MSTQIKEADITFKARGSEFEFIKIVYLEERELCTMKVQEVVFGDFKTADFPKSDFENLLKKLEACSVPFPGFSNGKDGNHYVLDIQSGENSMVYVWYGATQGEQWKDILAFKDELLGLKKKYL